MYVIVFLHAKGRIAGSTVVSLGLDVRWRTAAIPESWERSPGEDTSQSSPDANANSGDADCLLENQEVDTPAD